MSLPILVSVPHAGLAIPAEVKPYCCLTTDQLIKDGDEGAAEIYDFSREVVGYVSTDVPRAIVDMNRSEDDRRSDGVVKTVTIWEEPIYRQPLPAELVETLLAQYYRPYHLELTQGAQPGIVLGLDCHTMAATGPPIGPDPGQTRPWICLSNADGTCPDEWLRSMAGCFESAFGPRVSVNEPFKGGHIIRTHAAELPWIQLEISREPFMDNSVKRAHVLQALGGWVKQRGDSRGSDL